MTRRQIPVLDGQPSSYAQINVADLHAELAKSFQGEIRFDRLSRALYSTDASVYQIVPLGVLLPKSEEDIALVLKTCAQYGVPITARGGGTSQAGQCIGPGVILDCSKYLDKVLEINAAECWVRVQPGCVLDDLNLEVRPLGLQFAPDISTSNRATIGGMIANNSSGTRSVIYGLTIEHVLELKVLLSDGNIVHLRPLTPSEVEAKCGQQDLEGTGYRLVQQLAAEHAVEIDRRFPKILRRVGGYNLDRFCPSALAKSPFNLAHLFVGSEGTLGLTLEAKLRLVELPRAKTVLVIQFTDLLDALAAAPAILQHGPSAVEVIDKYVLDSTRLNPEASRLRNFLAGDPGAILIVELSGERAEELSARIDALEAELRARKAGEHFHRAVDNAGQSRIWKLRKAALGLSMAEKGDAKAISFVEDTAVAPQHLRDYIAEFLQVIGRHGTTAGVYAHASVGCLHVRPIVNLKSEEGVRKFEAIADEVSNLVLKYGGALSGEHGDGLVRSSFQEKMFGPILYDAFRQIKRTFDPRNLLNPGKIVDAPPLATNLRYGPRYVTPDVPTTFDFSVDGGIVRSAELCAGVGECRKKRDGSMCPSYQATRDEMHSTRGRANVLRLAMTGQLGMEGLTDPAVKEVLDLCLECKACKSECPTNVDMARLKAEFLHQYYRKHGLPWRNWILGNVAKLSSHRFLCWLGQTKLARWFNEKAFGIDSRRSLPTLSRRNFWKRAEPIWLRSYPTSPKEGIVFFTDTFVNYYEAAVGLAAIELLHRLGFPTSVATPGLSRPSEIDVQIVEDDPGYPPPVRCCGRPMISNGLLSQALEHAQDNVNSLYPVALRGESILAAEPSCILTIKDDYPSLLRGEDRRKAEAVAKMCLTFEEFLESRLGSAGCPSSSDDANTRGLTPPAQPLTFRAGPKRILVHPHCHQRALVGVEPLMRLLRRIPGADVIDLDAGCCGMAGSFGYEKEHYEISRLVGEQRLFPAIRAADPDTVIVAPGFSCRMQIEHFTGRKALHPAELLARLIDDGAPSR
jgi:FAD/FMN-containing dehydrogenase/Fe-S oxidoreductase